MLIGYVLLVMVFCLPLGRMHNNVLKSAKSFDGEYSVLVHDNLATRTDDWTDALMMLTAENGEDRNPFTASIFAYHAMRNEVPPHALIKNLENPENGVAQYSRYWHGYLLFLKPLLMFFNYEQIQVFIMLVVIALTIAVVYMLQKKKMERFIIPYGVTVALLYPLAIMISLQFLSVFVIFNVAILYILWRSDKMLKERNSFFVFLVIGMLTCYFDFLTFPIVTLGIPLIVWLIVSNREKAMKLSKNVLQIVIDTLGWVIGYFGIWVGKWAWGSLVTGQNLFKSAMEAAESRSSASAFSEEISRFSPVKEAFNVMFSWPVCVLLIIALIVLVVMLIMKKIRVHKQKMVDNLWMLLVGLAPIAWYVVFANHSESHIFFTFRTLSVLTFAVSCYVFSIFEKLKLGKKRKGQNG